jgi:signal transduction histidine kinase
VTSGPAPPALLRGAFLLLVAGATSILPPASAQTEPSLLLAATYEVDLAIDVGELEEHYAPAPPLPFTGQPGPVGACGSDHFTFNRTRGWFRFRESATENGCGEALYHIDLPQGTTDVDVRFKADRAIQQQSAVDLPKNMHQALRIYDERGLEVTSFDYFDESSAVQPTPIPFAFHVELAPDESRMALGWSFRDEGETYGASGVNPIGGQAFAASVSAIEVTLGGIPAQGTEVWDDRLGLQGDSVRRATHVVLPIPASLGPEGTVSARMQVPASLSFSHARGPGGERVHADHVTTSEAQGIRQVVLTADATRVHGPGEYDVVFTSSTALSPSTGLYPFIIAVLFVPVAAGAVSLRTARDLRRQATPEFKRTATTLHRLLIGLVALYLMLPILILASGRLPLLASWPLEGEAGFVYLLIGLAFVGFVGFGLLERRHLASIMAQESELQEQARRELERSNRELEEFAYVASHDLQEPLRAVASYTQLLQRRYKGKLDAEADQYIGSAVEGAHRMQALIKDLLAYSRVGSKPEPYTPVDLNSVAGHVRSLFAQTLEETQGQIAIKELPTLLGSERQFTQLLQNLVGNALKFRSPKRDPRITVSAEKVGDAWRVSVQDNGIGVEAQHHERIFHIFQRLHHRKEYPGTGIGLAVCKRIVELRGGTIGVESTPGEGSTFHFTIPETPPHARATKYLGKAKGEGEA